MIDWLSPVYEILKDALAWLGKRFKKPDPIETLENRKKWRSEFESHFTGKKRGIIYSEAIIRDLSRINDYPEVAERSRGISPWFKVGVKGLYHRGIEVIIGIHSLVELENQAGWRFARRDEDGDVNAFLVGRIPFDAIATVDWQGDNHYPGPHIYCRFNKNKGPYEELLYFISQGTTEFQYLEKVAKYRDVVKMSQRPWFRRF
ncbi:MAG: hypothetical protein QME21_06630 [Anaerolineales bacterium]|nr:hypothetical protein [Anaerolineales bacterium]